MKTAAIRIVLTIALLLSIQSISAQRFFDFFPEDPTARAEKITGLMTTRWQLDEDQQRDLSLINEKYAMAMQPALESQASPLKKLESVRTMISERILETKKALTEKQLATIKERWNLLAPIMESYLREFFKEK